MVKNELWYSLLEPGIKGIAKSRNANYQYSGFVPQINNQNLDIPYINSLLEKDDYKGIADHVLSKC